mmetsp:Transcript_14502/g.22382  ORF Transcript_14502/g.22382 Transcript_14502/m.22382 type:complete len:322 (-) Transcript_14502:229-1194(-)
MSNSRGHLILVRHGQSLWNVTSNNTKARFTGWTDIGLTELGRLQARAAGRAIWNNFSEIDCTLCSLLGRARTTLDLLWQEQTHYFGREQCHSNNNNTTRISSWRLNERHYGALVGLSKVDAEEIYPNLSSYRHGWDVKPPPMDSDQRMEWSRHFHCQSATLVHANDRRIKMIEKARSFTKDRIPASESLKDTCDRVLPLWKMAMVPRLSRGETLLVVAHANTIKAMLYFLDPQVVNEQSFNQLKIPSALPLVYEFENNSFSNSSRTEIPGGLFVVPPASESNDCDDNLRYKLNGTWLDTHEIQETKFCSLEGEEHLEHEIA